MAALPEARKFSPGVQSLRGEEPLLIGLIGPPGGGKTVSALRLATGMRKVRPGPVVLIDTEGGRSAKYSPEKGKPADPGNLIFDFLRVDMVQPFRPHDFLAAIRAQLPLNPAAIIIDTMSSEHEDEGGFLSWHDQIATAKRGEPGYVGGNEWAAWALPKAARKILLSGLMQIKTPLLFTFRAREKTRTEPGKNGGRDQIVNIGWMPVAPLEIVHSLDLTCILPPRADGVPVWSSEKVGEDFIVKLPHFLAPLIQKGALSEATGEALARWAKGDASQGSAPGADRPASGQPAAQGAPSSADQRQALLAQVTKLLKTHCKSKEQRAGAVEAAFGMGEVQASRLPLDELQVGLTALRHQLEGLAAMAAGLPLEPVREREPGEDAD